jgi:hypothetical protein
MLELNRAVAALDMAHQGSTVRSFVGKMACLLAAQHFEVILYD